MAARVFYAMLACLFLGFFAALGVMGVFYAAHEPDYAPHTHHDYYPLGTMTFIPPDAGVHGCEFDYNAPKEL